MSRSTVGKTRSKQAKHSWRRPAKLLSDILGSLKDAFFKAHSDDCVGMAKEAAYSFILSFFPMLLALITLFIIIGDPTRTVREILTTLRKVMPANSHAVVASYVTNYIEKAAAEPPTKLLWFFLAGTLWTASGIMSSLNKAFNKIYDVKSKRNFWTSQILSMLMVIAVGVPMLASAVAVVFAEQIEWYLANKYGLSIMNEQLWAAAHSLLVAAITLVIASLLYRVNIERKQTWRGVIPGAILATLLWLSLTVMFNVYVQHFGSYDRVYGSLGAVVVLLIWMFLTSLTLLYGAEFNLQFECRRRNEPQRTRRS